MHQSGNRNQSINCRHRFASKFSLPLNYLGWKLFNAFFPRTLESFARRFAQGSYQFWMATNAPKKIENPAFYRQKLNYIHENPVRKSYVIRPEHWFWSSANPSSPLLTKFL